MLYKLLKSLKFKRDPDLELLINDSDQWFLICSLVSALHSGNSRQEDMEFVGHFNKI